MYIHGSIVHCKNVACYMTLRTANHTVIRVANTTQCHMIHQLVWYAHFIFYTKNVVCYMTLQSANHTVIRVANTTLCHMMHQLVWYAHFIFYSVYVAIGSISMH